MPKSTAVSRAGGGDEQVPLVQVGVEDAVVQRLGQEGADQVVGQGRAVEAVLRQRGGIGQRRAGRPFQRQHPPARRRPRPPAAPACSRRAPSPRAARRRRPPRSAGPAPAPAPAPPSRRRRAAPAAATAATRPRPDAPPVRSASTSAATRRSIPGRSTFTATWRPSISFAWCAWASDAPAIASSNSLKRLSSGRPSAAATSVLASSAGNGGRRSFSRDRSSANARPKMSARVDRNWPSLIATGPSRSSAPASRSPGRPLPGRRAG